VIRFKNKHAPAAVKRWLFSISTISSPSQSRETVPLKEEDLVAGTKRLIYKRRLSVS